MKTAGSSLNKRVRDFEKKGETMTDDEIRKIHGKGAIPKKTMEIYRKIASEAGYQTLRDLYDACGNNDGEAATIEELSILAGYAWKCEAGGEEDGDACGYVNDSDAGVCAGCDAEKTKEAAEPEETGETQPGKIR